MGSLAIVKQTLEEHGKVQRGEIEAPEGVDRALQSTEDSPRQVVLFDDCVFDANQQDEFRDFTEFGLITIRTDTNDVTIKNTIFRNNLFGNEEVAGVSSRETSPRDLLVNIFHFLTCIFLRRERDTPSQIFLKGRQ
jgi:hypothetical protein